MIIFPGLLSLCLRVFIPQRGSLPGVPQDGSGQIRLPRRNISKRSTPVISWDANHPASALVNALTRSCNDQCPAIPNQVAQQIISPAR
jgi:hypothetical protein